MVEWQVMQVLAAAHRAGLEVLRGLERAAIDLREGRRARALEGFERAMRFFEGDLKVHFAQEERALSPALAKFIGRAGPIGAMVEEHDSLWREIDDLVDGVRDLGNESAPVDDARIQDLERLAHHVVFALRGHIQREDTMLFPLAVKTLDERDRREVEHNIQVLEGLAPGL